MKRATEAALHRINVRFHEANAEAFSATRERPWVGWERVLDIFEARVAPGPTTGEPFEPRPADGARISVLDLGCGNGRFVRFLEARWSRPFSYLGIDSSRALLRIARARHAVRPERRFMARDLLLAGLPAAPVGAPFHLIALFGLLHCVPGLANRSALLGSAARLLAPGGLMAVSFWQFGDRERFLDRVVGWESYNRGAATPIDADDLEPGDALLAWGEVPERGQGGGPPVRYCHWTSPAEADRLLGGLDLDTVAAFSADGDAGDLNLYRLLRRA